MGIEVGKSSRRLVFLLSKRGHKLFFSSCLFKYRWDPITKAYVSFVPSADKNKQKWWGRDGASWSNIWMILNSSRCMSNGSRKLTIALFLLLFNPQCSSVKKFCILVNNIWDSPEYFLFWSSTFLFLRPCWWLAVLIWKLRGYFNLGLWEKAS